MNFKKELETWKKVGITNVYLGEDEWEQLTRTHEPVNGVVTIDEIEISQTEDYG